MDEFEWDEAKAVSNLRKHGVSFEVVRELYWTGVDARVDDRRDYGELRLRVMLVGKGQDRFMIVYTPRGRRRRIISVRRAHLEEYEEWQA